MTLEVLTLINLIHKAPFKEEGWNKIAFATVDCTRFKYIENCLKNTYYSGIQTHTHVGNMLPLYFIVTGFFSCNMYPFL